jgi:hypothetical protein
MGLAKYKRFAEHVKQINMHRTFKMSELERQKEFAKWSKDDDREMKKTKRQTVLVAEMIEEKEKVRAALQKLLFDLKWDPHPHISKSAEKVLDDMDANLRRAITDDPEGFTDCFKMMDYEGDRSCLDVIALQRKNHYSSYGLKADNPNKPCRAMRDGTDLCGDLPRMAPEGKCYFDHQKDCNAWCTQWEGDEDISEDPRDWHANKIAEMKIRQLGIRTNKIVKDAITEVILAGIELCIVGDLSDMDAIKEIEACLEDIKKKEEKK